MFVLLLVVNAWASSSIFFFIEILDRFVPLTTVAVLWNKRNFAKAHCISDNIFQRSLLNTVRAFYKNILSNSDVLVIFFILDSGSFS